MSVKANDSPYTATLDTQGRLTKLVVDLPESEKHEAGRWTLEFSRYGSVPAHRPPPAAEVARPSRTLMAFLYDM